MNTALNRTYDQSAFPGHGSARDILYLGTISDERVGLKDTIVDTGTAEDFLAGNTTVTMIVTCDLPGALRQRHESETSSDTLAQIATMINAVIAVNDIPAGPVGVTEVPCIPSVGLVEVAVPIPLSPSMTAAEVREKVVAPAHRAVKRAIDMAVI